MDTTLEPAVRSALLQGTVIPASPLALDRDRQWDERRQRALWRYYAAAGAGGIAIGVHTTQFAIRDPQVGLFGPLLELARDELDRLDAGRSVPLIRVSGVCGDTDQAVQEAGLGRELGFHAGLLSLSAMRDAPLDRLIDHCRAVAEVIPQFGFYLQPAVGGVVLPYTFWRRLLELTRLVAIKTAPFNRYYTLDVVRAVAESGRSDVALYTGNDDNIVLDLITPYRFPVQGRTVECRFVGGLLGHWACWTRSAVQLLAQCHAVARGASDIPADLLRLNVEVTDANAVLFDAAHDFAGCIPGVHAVLHRQGLLEGTWCLDPAEQLSSGQAEEIERIYRSYPHLTDDAFVREHLVEWLAD